MQWHVTPWLRPRPLTPPSPAASRSLTAITDYHENFVILDLGGFARVMVDWLVILG
jgi:hypothetical protein